MDLYKALRELHREKKRLDDVIAVLETQFGKANGADRIREHKRGRRSMSQAERQEVSRRMSRYWASRRSRQPESTEPGRRAQGGA